MRLSLFVRLSCVSFASNPLSLSFSLSFPLFSPFNKPTNMQRARALTSPFPVKNEGSVARVHSVRPRERLHAASREINFFIFSQFLTSSCPSSVHRQSSARAIESSCNQSSSSNYIIKSALYSSISDLGRGIPRMRLLAAERMKCLCSNRSQLT